MSLPCLVGSEDLWNMLQVPLGQPEAISWAIPFEPNKVLWLFVGSYQSVLNNVLHLELFFTM